jgi:hypothetical protein
MSNCVASPAKPGGSFGRVDMRAALRRIAIAGFATLALPLVAGGQSGDPPPNNSNGNVVIFAAAGNEIVHLTTTIIVPDPPVRSPKHDGTVFLWPGLQPQPGYANYLPIGNGVLQSVLSWGPSCAPGTQLGGWWISPQYVNTDGQYMGYQGCFGGPILGLNPKDQLLITMSLEHGVWRQTIRNLGTGELADFYTNLAGQAQAYARFEIEVWDGALSPDVTFLHTTIGFAHPDAGNCSLAEQGPDDVVSTPVLADDKQSCSIENITLRGPGVTPTKARRRPR